MNEQLTPTQEAAADKALSYGIFEGYTSVVALPGSAQDDVFEANQAKADYLRMEVPGNANPYVPWTSPDLDFQCPTCDVTITAKQEHPLHPEDQELLERYPARLDNVM